MFARHDPSAVLSVAAAAAGAGGAAKANAPRRPVTPRGHGGASSLLRPGVPAARQAAPSAILPRAVLAVAAAGTQLSLFGPRLARR